MLSFLSYDVSQVGVIWHQGHNKHVTLEKHALTCSDHKTKGMVGRMLLRMNKQTDCLKIQYWCGSLELDSGLKV